jgi:16S rRNA (cytosine967-C5)-methyltransferase
MRRHVKTSEDPRVLAFFALQTLSAHAEAFAGDVLSEAFSRVPTMDARDRALATELVQGVLRWQGLLDPRLAPLVRQGLDGLETGALLWLRLGACQLALLDRMPREIAVSATIDAARLSGWQRVTGLLNAVLRRFAADLPTRTDGRRAPHPVRPDGEDPAHAELALARTLALPPAPSGEPEPLAAEVARLAGLPAWIAEHAVAAWGTGALDEALAMRRRPSLTLRPTRGGGSAEALVADLLAAGLPAAAGPGGLVTVAHGDPFRTEAWRQGRFVAQDPASHAVLVHTLEAADVPHPRVLDLCAGRGIKATGLADLGATVVAADVSTRKLASLQKLAERLGVSDRISATLAVDGTSEDPRLPGAGPYDVVLVDAPCSGLGTLRRHPEIAWRRQPSDITHLSTLQSRLLARARDLVKPGGAVVFATCSFAPAEAAPDLPGLTRTTETSLRPSHGGDAFQLAVFRRTSA